MPAPGRAALALLAYMAVSWSLLLLLPRYAPESIVPVAATGTPGEPVWEVRGDATLSRPGGAAVALEVPPGADGALQWRLPAPAADTLHARLRVTVPALTVVDETWDGARVVLLAEEPDGVDFGRPFRVFETREPVPATAAQFVVHPRADDSVYRLQVQSVGGGRVEVEELVVFGLDYTPLWRALRLAGLFLGYGLIFWLFLPDFRRVPVRPQRAAVLLSVAAILFGCTVPASVKADIYERLAPFFDLLPWGYGELPDSAVLLTPPHSWFSTMHFLFFAAAGASMVLAGETAARVRVLQLLLLAVGTETMQGWIPDRGPGIDDASVDLIGAACGAALALALLRGVQRVRLFTDR